MNQGKPGNGKPGQQPLAFMRSGLVSTGRAARMMGRPLDTIDRLIEQGIFDVVRFTDKGWRYVEFARVVEYMNHINAGGTPAAFLEKLRQAQH